MKPISETLKAREIVSLKQAAETAGVDQRTLRQRMAENEIPMIEWGPRKRSLRLTDFDKLVSLLANNHRQPEVA
jgi:hypothetical protein